MLFWSIGAILAVTIGWVCDLSSPAGKRAMGGRKWHIFHKKVLQTQAGLIFYYVHGIEACDNLLKTTILDILPKFLS